MKDVNRIDSKTAAALQSGYWRRETAELVLEAWAESGLSVAAFARQHGIQAKRLGWWRKRLEEVAEPAPVFHRVQLIQDRERDESGGDGAVELVLRGGRRISVRPGFDTATLEQLVRVVESWSC